MKPASTHGLPASRRDVYTRVSVVALLAIVGVIGWLAWRAQAAPPDHALEAFVTFAHEYEDVPAYQLTSTRFRGSVPLGDFVERLSTIAGLRTTTQVRIKKYQPLSFQAGPSGEVDVCRYLEDATAQGGTRRVRAHLVEEEGEWKIDQLAIEGAQLDPSSRILRAACPPTF